MFEADYSKREQIAVNALKNAIPTNLKNNMVKESKGFFCELYKNDEVFPNHFMATGVDGVGTKLILAIGMNKFDTIGQDLVAMNANDIATIASTKPFLFLDYLAVQHKIEEEEITGKIMKGIVKGLELADCSNIFRNSVKLNLGKGETASLDELISSPRQGYGFDIAGLMLGFVEKEKAKMEVKTGMSIVAFKSSGAHSNGYTALRHELLKGEFEERKEFKKYYKGIHSIDSEIAKTLLKPTIIYSKPLAEISKKINIIGINNTGYGLKNFNRLGKGIEYFINNPIKPDWLFEEMQSTSNYSNAKMYEKFNMSQGFFVLCNKNEEEIIIQTAKKHKIEAQIVGETRKSNKTKTTLQLEKEKIIFEGY